jgi:hypothetical protein
MEALNIDYIESITFNYRIDDLEGRQRYWRIHKQRRRMNTDYEITVGLDGSELTIPYLKKAVELMESHMPQGA